MADITPHQGLTRLQWKHWLPQPGSDNGMSPTSRLRGIQRNSGELPESTLAALGTGAVGGVVVQAAARHGVGTLIVVDPDSYGVDSWHTQPALPSDAGRPKAFVQAELAHAINPGCRIHAAVGFAQDVPLSVLRQARVIVIAGDNRELAVWAGQMGMNLGIDVIQGAVDGNTWTAFARGYHLTNPQSACPACTMSKAEFRQLSSRYGCDPETARLQGREPTRTLPVICATAGQLAFGEALKRLLGMDRQALAGEEVAYCLLTHRLYRTELPASPQCRCRHQRWQQADISEPLTDVTLAMLADRLGHSLDGLQVRSDVPWISFTLCPACGHRNDVRHFARLTESVGRCACGAELMAGPVGKRLVLSADDLKASGEVPLASLGLGPGAAVGLSPAEEWTYFFAAGWPYTPEEKAAPGSAEFRGPICREN